MDILEHTEIFGLIAPVAVEIVAFGIVKEFTETLYAKEVIKNMP
jgi:hypothetical protein